MSYMNLVRRLIAVAVLVPGVASASVVITGTRVIYPAQATEVTVKLSNNGIRPALVQSWVDRGDASSTPTRADAPFLLSPPVTRIDPGKGQTLRLMATPASLAQDRETVFWLNVLDIPPEADATEGSSLLQMAFRSRIKIFFRPKGLPGTATEAISQLQWRLLESAQGQPRVLQAFNPSAYHVSLVELSVGIGAQRATAEGGMVAPGETLRFTLSATDAAPSADADVAYSAINDHGALLQVRAPLQR